MEPSLEILCRYKYFYTRICAENKKQSCQKKRSERKEAVSKNVQRERKTELSAKTLRRERKIELSAKMLRREWKTELSAEILQRGRVRKQSSQQKHERRRTGTKQSQTLGFLDTWKKTFSSLTVITIFLKLSRGLKTEWNLFL